MSNTMTKVKRVLEFPLSPSHYDVGLLRSAQNIADGSCTYRVLKRALCHSLGCLGWHEPAISSEEPNFNESRRPQRKSEMTVFNPNKETL
jgi:hypothetical protein